MAIAFDAVSSVVVGAVSSSTHSHTCAGSDRLLTVGVSIHEDTATLVSSITYAGVALALVGESNPANNNARVLMYRLVAPATGANNVVVTFSDALGNGSVIGAISYTGVHQAVPLGTFASATGSTTTPTVNVASAANELVQDVVAERDSETLAVGAGQTERYQRSLASTVRRSAASTEPGAASVTMSWTATSRWAIGGVSIKPAAAVSAGRRSIAFHPGRGPLPEARHYKTARSTAVRPPIPLAAVIEGGGEMLARAGLGVGLRAEMTGQGEMLPTARVGYAVAAAIEGLGEVLARASLSVRLAATIEGHMVLAVRGGGPWQIGANADLVFLVEIYPRQKA